MPRVVSIPSLTDLARLLASITGIAGVAVALLWGCGFLVARPLLPRRYRPLLPLIAPFLGFSLISAVSHYAGAAGAPLRSVLWLLVGLAAAGWAVVLLDRRLRRFPRDPVLAVCLLAFVLALGPLLLLGYLTTVGATIDGISYAVRSEYLQEAPLRLPEIEPGKPYIGWVRLQIDLARAGDVYLVGLLGLLTGRRSYELLTVVPALFFALTAGSVYVLARASLGFGRRAALLASALVAVHNLLLWPVYDNFLSQVIALSLMPLVLAFGVEAQRRPDWRMAALFAILFTGLVSVYPAFAVLALAAVLFFWGLAWLLRPRGPRWRSLGRAALWWLRALTLAALWNGVALARSATELGLLAPALTSGGEGANVGPGNIVVFPPAVEILGLISHAAAAYGNGWKRVPLPVLNALGLVFAGLAIYGWWRLRPRARLAVAALLMTGALLVVQQRWDAQYPYGYFKAVTTMVAEVMMLVAAGIAALGRSRLRSVRWLAAGAALLLLTVNLKHSLWTQTFVLDHLIAADRELIGIARAASEVPPDAWVLLDIDRGLRQHWLGYLIRERKIRFRDPLWFGDVDNPGAANAFFRYAVVEKKLDELRRPTAPDEPWYTPATYVRLSESGRYELRERRDPVLASVQWERRWPEQAALALSLSRETLSVQVGPEVEEGGVGSGLLRTLQVRLYSLAPSSRFEVAGVPVVLGPGGWLLDVDLGCIAGRRIGIGHATGDVVLSDVRVLGTVTGRPGACLEKTPLPTGVAYLEQHDLGEGRIQFRAAVARAQDDEARRYRLGLHVIEVDQGKLFGVWALDFPPHPRIQHGSIELDLRDRSSKGEIDGRPVDLAVDRLDTDEGSFAVDAVWWQFDPLDQLLIHRMLWFQRHDYKSVRVTAAVPVARLEVLSAP